MKSFRKQVVFQVQTQQGLSKSYSVTELKRKRELGIVTDRSRCTPDRGQTWIRLGKILADADGPNPVRSRAHKLNSGDQFPAQVEPFSSVSSEPAESELVTDSGEDGSSYRLKPHPQFDAVPTPQPSGSRSHSPQWPPPRIDAGMSRLALAAAAALKAEEDAAAQRNSLPAERRDAEMTDEDADADDEDVDFSPPRSALTQVMTVGVVLAGLSSVGLLFWWHFSGKGPPSLADMGYRNMEVSAANPGEAMSMEELSARVQIMAYQIGRLNKAVPESDTDLQPDVTAPMLSDLVRVPLVPFAAREFSADEQKNADDLMSRYALLVRQKGPDGRELDASSVELYSRYLRQLITGVDGKADNRAAAVHELAELTKLLYLLQLKNTRSPDPELRRRGGASILEAANEGLSLLYSEFAAGDLNFNDLFRSCDRDEKPSLLLIRYWYYRSFNKSTADQWLQSMLPLVDAGDHGSVNASVREVDAIE